MKAYFLVNARPGKIRELTRQIASIPGVRMANASWGGPDMFVVSDAASAENFNSRTEEYQKRLAELSTAMDGLQRRSDALLADFQDQLKNTLEQSVSRDVTEELEKAAKDLLNRSTQQLQGQADATVAALVEELQASRQGFIEETRKQLANTPHVPLGSLTKAAAEEFRNQLTQSFQEQAEPLAKTATEECRRQLHKMLDEFLAKGVRAFEAEHAESMRLHREALQKQFEDLSKKARPEEYRQGYVPVEHTPQHGAAGPRAGLTVGLCLVVAALTFALSYLSIRPVTRLRVNPPVAFFEQLPEWGDNRRVKEEQLARVYWELAVREVQGKYRFGMNLPEEPPAEFKVEEPSVPGKGSKVDPVARARYWGKLRRVWVQPEAWERSSEWNTDWIQSTLGSTYLKAKHFVTG